MPIWKVQLSAVKNSFLCDMWKCHRGATAFIHVNMRDTFLSVGPRRQEAVNSPEESDLEDRLTHTSWTLLLIYITLVIKKTGFCCQSWVPGVLQCLISYLTSNASSKCVSEHQQSTNIRSILLISIDGAVVILAG